MGHRLVSERVVDCVVSMCSDSLGGQEVEH
jgi:hypothetical protein